MHNEIEYSFKKEQIQKFYPTIPSEHVIMASSPENKIIHLEKILATLEGGTDALAFSSGMAAISLLMEMFKPGDHIIADADLYGGSIRLFKQINEKNGLKFSSIDCHRENIEDYVTDSELDTTLAGYATSTDLSTGLAGKQDSLGFVPIAPANANITAIWLGTLAQYNALTSHDPSIIYVIQQ